MGETVIVWLNGTFGAGRTDTARELLKLLPDSTGYDPGKVGALLQDMLPAERDGSTDYRELPAWRRLVVETGAALLAETPGILVVQMELLRQEHRDEIFGGFAARRIPVRHFLLDQGETILREPAAPGSGRDADGAYPGSQDPGRHRAALPWLAADAHLVDVSALTPRLAAERIARAVHEGAGSCEIVQTPEPRTETVAAGVLLFDEQDRVLLVDPTYKPGWEFPGGVVEPGEAPARAGMREVAEETGIRLERVPGLLVVDWEPPAPPAFGGMRLLFDGGLLTARAAGRLTLPAAELRGWRFVTLREAAGMLPGLRYDRLRWAMHAREHSTVLNLEAGQPVGGTGARAARTG